MASYRVTLEVSTVGMSREYSESSSDVIVHPQLNGCGYVSEQPEKMSRVKRNGGLSYLDEPQCSLPWRSEYSAQEMLSVANSIV